jgi:hypothetical protein
LLLDAESGFAAQAFIGFAVLCWPDEIGMISTKVDGCERCIKALSPDAHCA